MTIKNDNEDGQTRYVKRYMTDIWLAHIIIVRSGWPRGYHSSLLNIYFRLSGFQSSFPIGTLSRP